MKRGFKRRHPMTSEFDIRTHQKISTQLSGRVLRLEPGTSEVELSLSDEMAADSTGLVHGGFIFSAADYAAMLAVNDPFVVLAGAVVRFFLPSRVGDVLWFSAKAEAVTGSKRSVSVRGFDAARRVVFEGVFECAVLPGHVLERRAT